MTEQLHLRAETADDLILISSCVQDMAIKAADVAWLPKQRRLVLLGNRFRWETAVKGPRQGGAPSRVRSALRLDFVQSVQRKGWPTDPEAVLPLLAVTFESEEENGVETLILSFGGGAALRVTQEVLDLTLEDISGPWGTQIIPEHD